MSRPDPAPTHPDLGFARDGTDAQGQLRTTEEYRAALRAEYARLLAIDPAERPDSVGGWKFAHTADNRGSGEGDLLFGRPRLAGGMTEEEKFTFDCAGFIVRPAILSAEEVTAIREQLYLITHDPDALPPHERRVPGGAASVLIDHPKVVEVLDELYGPSRARLEHAQAFWRTRGQRESNADTDGLAQGWHSGGPGSYTDPNFGYRYKNGSMTAGTLRVIFELGEVSQQDGGTQFILGSHKANYPMAPAFLRRGEEEILDLKTKRSPLIAGYDCPPGSAIFFAEATCHVGPPWQADHPRVSVLHLYAHVATNFHGLQATFDRNTLAGLPLERLAFFRPPLGNRGSVTVDDFVADPDMSWGNEGVGKGSGEGGEDGVVVQLLSLEAMRSRGSLSEEEFEDAKKLLLREGKASL